MVKNRRAVRPLTAMTGGEAPADNRPRIRNERAHGLFFSVFVPLGSIANLVLGLWILSGLARQAGDLGFLEVGTGGFCCMVAGWLAAAAWSRYYWNRSLKRQVAVWYRIVDAFFSWLEEAPLPIDALTSLKSSLDKAESGSVKTWVETGSARQ